MKVTVIAGSELTPELVGRWRRIQESDTELASPYFCPDFTQAVAAVRRDVFVGVMENAGVAVGFFPFQRGRMGVGNPVGGAVSDFHGVIALPEVSWDVPGLLRACRLATFEFTHLLASQQPFRPYHAAAAGSHFMDLSEGFDSYAARLREARSHVLKDVRAKCRKLQQLGEVRFVPHTGDTRVLRALLAWKSSQYQRSGLVNVFSFDWTVALLERIHATQHEHFGGMLSALYVNDELVAAHMGMRSRCVWNWWFPRHDERFAKMSPGILLRVYAAETAEGLGIRRIDLGLGDESTYKPRLATGSIPLADGRVELRSLVTAARRLRRDAEAWVRRSPLLPIARVPGRLPTRMERRRRFR